jgi:hypothetical protein
MTRTSYQLVYPDGDIQEIENRLVINQIVDLNGVPLSPPLRTARMIAYRVFRISTNTRTGEEIVSYYLDLLTRDELEELTR